MILKLKITLILQPLHAVRSIRKVVIKAVAVGVQQVHVAIAIQVNLLQSN